MLESFSITQPVPVMVSSQLAHFKPPEKLKPLRFIDAEQGKTIILTPAFLVSCLGFVKLKP